MRKGPIPTHGGAPIRVCVGLLVMVIAVGRAIGNAQVPATAAPAFEVASVKRNLSGRVGGAFQIPPVGTLTFTNVMLRVLIRLAYDVDPYAETSTLDAGAYARIVGKADAGPQTNVPRFDVRAKPPDNTQPAERRAMMRTLLEDRFKLRVHREMRPMPVYVLTVAREGRLGPALVRSSFDCPQYMSQRRAGGNAPAPVDADGTSWCMAPVDMSRPDVVVDRNAGPVRLLVERLEPIVGRPVIDSTHLSGNFEWVLTYRSGPRATDVPTLFAALQDQLGLKLESRQAPVDVLVIDSVELPRSD